MIRDEGDVLDAVLVCPPGPAYFGTVDLDAQNITAPPDPDPARLQHAALVARMRDFGARVVESAEPEGQANATFTRDPALVTPEGYVALRMGLAARTDEPRWMAALLEAEGLPRFGAIHAPGTVEGGDVFLAGRVALVTRSARTNPEGARQLSALLEDQGYEVRVTDLPEPYLHLGSVLSVIAPGRVLVLSGALTPRFLDGFDVLEIPRPRTRATGANLLCLGPNEVVANEGDGDTPIRILEENGVRVHRLDLSEFRKGNGGPTCLALPLKRG